MQEASSLFAVRSDSQTKAGEEHAARVTELLARTMRLAGASGSALVGGDQAGLEIEQHEWSQDGLSSTLVWCFCKEERTSGSTQADVYTN